MQIDAVRVRRHDCTGLGVSVTVGLRRCVFPFSTLHIHLWASPCEARGFTTLRGSPFRLVLFMMSRGLPPFSKLAGGAPLNVVTSRIFVRPADLLSAFRLGLPLKVKPLGKGFFVASAHGALCSVFHAFGGGHRLDNWIHMGGSRCSGRFRREGWRHPNVALPGPTFFCVSHPMVTGEAAPGDALWH